VRTIALIAFTSLPMLLVFTLAAEPLLGSVYGDDLAGASSALPFIGLAMTLLACAYLSVQYLLALGRSSFLWLLGVAAVVEPLSLIGIGAHFVGVAIALVLVQALVAASVVAMSLRGSHVAVEAVA